LIKLKTKFIINPISGTGKQIEIERNISSLVDKNIFNYDIEYTKKANHATEISSNAVKENYDLIVAVGGDGTVSECASALIGSQTALAIVPCGSGNGFAYNFNIKRKVTEALIQLNKNKIRYIDSCTANNLSFVNVSGIGFDAHIASLFANTKKRGFFSYIKLTIKELFYKPKKYKIHYENKIREVDAFAIVFANASQYGNDAKIAPLAKVDDGLIDFVIIKSFPNWQVPLFLLDVLRGKTHLNKNVEIIKTKKMLIESDFPRVHLDGEIKNLNNPIDIRIHNQNFKIFVPYEKEKK